jgi:RNA polymerase sigma-B factor
MRRNDFIGDDPATWELFVTYARTRERSVRTDLMERLSPLAESLARRFEGRGEPAPDLRQVALLGLLKAVERFDPSRGIPFASFAVPTIRGELRRHFRDSGWTVKVPRRVQELRLDVRSIADDLSHSLGRSPTVAEIAEAADVDEAAVLEAIEARHLYRVLSLDAPASREADGGTLSDQVGGSDRELERAEARQAIRPMLDGLAERERRIVYLRFFEDRSQSEIASIVGLSQMHVSRLLASSLRQMRSIATVPPSPHVG